MAVRKHQVGDVVVLSLKGSFFGDRETDELQKAIMDEAAAGTTRLLLNMKDCEALNSLAIGVLTQGYVNFRKRNGAVRLCCLSQRPYQLLAMVQLINLFGHYESESEAIASFSNA